MANMPTIEIPIKAVRARKTDAEKIADGASQLVEILVSAWVVMLVLGARWHAHLTYLDVLLGIWVLRNAMGNVTRTRLSDL